MCVDVPFVYMRWARLGMFLHMYMHMYVHVYVFMYLFFVVNVDVCGES